MPYVVQNGPDKIAKILTFWIRHLSLKGVLTLKKSQDPNSILSCQWPGLLVRFQVLVIHNNHDDHDAVSSLLKCRPSLTTTIVRTLQCLYAKLSSLVCVISALALAFNAAYKNERAQFYASYYLFEACTGMYYPAPVSKEHRSTA